MRIYFNRIVLIGWCFILAAALSMSSACRPELNTNQTLVDNDQPIQPAASPTSTPELNEKRLPAMYFRAWHRSKPGMILDESVGFELFYLAAPGDKLAPFNEYEAERHYEANSNRSPSGKFEVNVNKFNERSRSSGCCAIQEFDYEVVLSEVKSPANKTVLSDKNWDLEGWSPDDKFILFSGYSELLLINAETKEKIPIFSGRNAMKHVFDRSGKGLFLINRSEEVTRFEYFDFASRQLMTILSPLKTEPAMSLSPDGRKLALFYKIFKGKTTDTAENFLYLFDTESKAKIAEHHLPVGGINYSPGWRPDGSEFAFNVGGENYTQEVYSVNIENGGLTRWYPPKGETTGLYKQK